MNTIWRKFVANDEDVLKEVQNLLVTSDKLLEKLIQLCLFRINEIRNKNIADESYDSPGWALRQAEQVGRVKQLNELINLLTLDKSRDK